MATYNISVSTVILEKKVSKYLLSIPPIATLIVSPFSNYDPINLIKNLVVTSGAFFILGLLLSNLKFYITKDNKVLILVSGGFFISMLSTMFFSQAPLNQQFWGTFGRGTGFLTYFSLLILLVSSAILTDKKFHNSLILALIYTSIPVSLYALIQIAKLDPIRWSLQDTFATLGNSNFLSAFLGMSSIATFVFVFENRAKSFKFTCILMIIINQWIILTSGSIQGFLIFLAGVGVAGFFLLRRFTQAFYLLRFYDLLAIVATTLAVFGVFNRGPLARIIFQPSVLYRADYMHAGFKMTIAKPFTGVGLDSYGDWYRQVRGVISTLRTGPERTANASHNIFLDISSNGGFPLLIFYGLLLLLALNSSMKYLKINGTKNLTFVAIFSVWVAYQIQAAISINQIGVGIWGWILTGSLIGFSKFSSINSRNELTEKMSSRRKKRNKSDSVLPPSSALFAMIFLCMGFLLAFMPFRADMEFKKALEKRSLTELINSVHLPASNAFLLSQVIQGAVQSNFLDQAHMLALESVKKYPRDNYGWKILYFLSNSTPEEKELALITLKELDPFNPDLSK